MKNYDYLTKAGKYTQNGFVTSYRRSVKSSYYGLSTMLGILLGIVVYLVTILK